MRRTDRVSFFGFELSPYGRGSCNIHDIFSQFDRVSISFPAPPVLTPSALYKESMFQFPDEFTQYGRTTVYPLGESFIAVKAMRESESPEGLRRELQIQALLREDSVIRSHVPFPIGHSDDLSNLSNSIIFKVQEGYYNYVSEIQDREIFIKGLCMAAHDLGYLLRKYGLVFPALISVFHTMDRPYTLLPENTFAQRADDFGGLPGRIEGIIGRSLYENIGETGLRDFGDLVSIAEYSLPRPSDYLRRSQSPLSNDFSGSHELYTVAMNSLFEGLGIELTPEQLDYVNLSRTKETVKELQPSTKYDQQLKFVFTKHKSALISCSPIPLNIDLSEFLLSVYGSTKVKWYSDDRKERDAILEGVYDDINDFYKPGSAGAFSGINPLATACKYALRAAHVVLQEAKIFCNETSPKNSL